MSNIRHDYEQDFSGTFPGSTPFTHDSEGGMPTDTKHPFTTNDQYRSYWEPIGITDEGTVLTEEQIKSGLENIARIRAERGWPKKPSPVLEQLEQAALSGQVEPPLIEE